MTISFLRLACLTLCLGFLTPESQAASIEKYLPGVYKSWRSSMLRKNVQSWKKTTSLRRQIEVRNRILSAKGPFPRAIFATPVPPPSLSGLKLVHTSVKGGTAKQCYYGKVDFGVGGKPTNNLYLVSYLQEGAEWKYDGAEFINLLALPEIRKQLDSGDVSYLKHADFAATGAVPVISQPVDNVKYIAKVYSFCPGRAVDVTVNGVSTHRFQNAQEAQIIIGGAKDGKNSVKWKVRKLEGGTGKEAFTVRVYLMNENPGKNPIKVYEYLVNEGGKVKSGETGGFIVSPKQGRAALPR